MRLSWRPCWGYLGLSWGLLRASWGPFGASRGPLWPSYGVPGVSDAVGSRLGSLSGTTWGFLVRFRVVLEAILDVLEVSWAVFGPSWGRLWGLLGRPGAVFEASWALLARSGWPLGPSGAVRKPKRSKPRNPSKTNGKSMNFASWALFWKPLGALLGRFGGLLGAYWAVLGNL